jgi:DNA repair protein RecO (recombination protein O)
MRSFKTEGIVIKRRNFQEADRLITIFSKKNGKITIKAAGVRKISSKRSPHIELLNRCIFNLHQGRTMYTLTEVESLENFSALKKDLEKIGTSYHLCELVDGLCAENQENIEIFELLDKTLKRVQCEDDMKKVSYDFELEILKLLGFYRRNDFSKGVDTQKIIEDILERKLKAKQILPRLS